MTPTIAQELASLGQLATSALRARYLALFGYEPLTGNRAWLVKRIAWRLQVQAEGDLSERARGRARELANDADLRLSPPPSTMPPATSRRRVSNKNTNRDPRLPAVGQILMRRYKGQIIQVTVLAHGFEYAGALYPSLSAVAKAIAGCHWNGFHFFGLHQHGARS
jgi:Protein of unknown function (DUF2924)